MSKPHTFAALRAALMPYENWLDRMLTLIWLRQLMDPQMPTIAGFDPRTFGFTARWHGPPAPAGRVGRALDAFAAPFNDAFGEPMLATGWADDEDTAVRAMAAMAEWKPAGTQLVHGGDLLGVALQEHRSDKASRGAYYTPYHVCLLMARINDAKPGERVIDPACGSGRMLLASLEVCREQYGGNPRIFGVDLDPYGVRACRLNLALAGLHTAPAERRESVTATESAVAVASTEAGQFLLDLALPRDATPPRRRRR